MRINLEEEEEEEEEEVVEIVEIKVTNANIKGEGGVIFVPFDRDRCHKPWKQTNINWVFKYNEKLCSNKLITTRNR